MKLFHTISEWQSFRRQLPSHTTLGFVPTMGNLHQGHASLYKASQQENDNTLASLFINPTQFNQSTDYIRYPRTLDADLELLTHLGVDYCLLPTKEDIYQDGYHFQIQENNLSVPMEGEKRPGHFTGVLTVVMKLLNIAKPHRAYFGEKDYQQFQLIQNMVSAFFMDIETKSCPTIREKSGLACSSRNNRLNKEERLLADQFAKLFHQRLPDEQLIASLNELGITTEYVAEQKGRRYIAVQIGDVRLIDNYSVTSE